MSNKATSNFTKAVSGQPIRDNGATVLMGGNIDSSDTVTNAPSSDITGHRSGKHGSRPTDPTTQGDHPNLSTMYASQSSTQYAKMVAGNYIGRKYTSQTMAGDAYSVLETGASDFGRRSIHLNEQQVSLLQITAGWDQFGNFLTTPVVQVDSFGTDDAARPTRAIPGELQYTDHGMAHSGPASVPKLDNYKPKT